MQATYVATTDYPLVHEVDPNSLGVVAAHYLNPLTDGISLSSCSHWRREVGTNYSLNFHQMLNPATLGTDFVLFRFGNNWQERKEVRISRGGLVFNMPTGRTVFDGAHVLHSHDLQHPALCRHRPLPRRHGLLGDAHTQHASYGDAETARYPHKGSFQIQFTQY